MYVSTRSSIYPLIYLYFTFPRRQGVLEVLAAQRVREHRQREDEQEPQKLQNTTVYTRVDMYYNSVYSQHVFVCYAYIS